MEAIIQARMESDLFRSVALCLSSARMFRLAQTVSR
jgi:hypothetical protein